MAFKPVVVRSLLTATLLLAAPRAFADDAPVEKPAVDRPALPQPGPSAPAESSRPAQSSGRNSSQSQTPHQTKHSGSGTSAGGGDAPAGGNTQRVFPYLAAGPGVLIGLSGGQDFERTNPALTGAVGLEIPVARATGLAIELNGDLELAASSDRGTYTALLLRGRLGRMLTPRNRVWGALGFGGAGYQSTSFAFGLAGGTSLMLVPKFGLDF
ncbi:MAG TPA: hypothetical protein VER11_30660, partial [Polyangiaceae bacterium]|nr:hypothetical protein [Polyangiaceae bacterium]